MLMMSGYTLGFFFPKQARHIAKNSPAPVDENPKPAEIDLAFTRPDAGSEAREVPAGFYFYRHF